MYLIFIRLELCSSFILLLCYSKLTPQLKLLAKIYWQTDVQGFFLNGSALNYKKHFHTAFSIQVACILGGGFLLFRISSGNTLIRFGSELNLSKSCSASFTRAKPCDSKKSFSRFVAFKFIFLQVMLFQERCFTAAFRHIGLNFSRKFYINIRCYPAATALLQHSMYHFA